ncbi:hypothetical protein [Subtercola boreus]|uniref:hypothetical protein n=1 Tax=Subtercola boreus TaxID=120213 RepID=UPI001153886A|nr:hypothetical protein [Subtercola boreus]TQL55301.1 hypothetical protein FB464_2864 [Subtercola boreus]
MLPGRSAGALAVPLAIIGQISFLFLLMVVASIAIGLPETHPGVIVVVTFVAIALSGVGATAVLYGIVGYRAANEVRFGYTTLRGAHQEVEELDPATGRTIRGAGEPFLDKQTRARRIEDRFDLSESSSVPARPGNPYARRRTPGQWVVWSMGIAAGVLAVLVRTGVLK